MPDLRTPAENPDDSRTTTLRSTTLSEERQCATDVERARVAVRELDGLSGELNRLVGVFTV